MQKQWWQDAVVYQIYPRSFADSNGDGIGDLSGITSRIPYLCLLGIDAVWLSPFYPSALADGGYDVDDYCGVDPRLGSLADFDELVEAIHRAGLRIIIDIVPNHTSNRHPWFQAALAAPPGSPERDRYIFRPGVDGGPPNDWRSGFGGPIWEPVGDDQWYFHFFSREQPDLNWDNPEVREFFCQVLRFWCDRGVDGFRVDVAHGLKKDFTGFARPWAEVGLLPVPGHPLWDVPGLFEIYAGWREVLDSYDPPRFAVAESMVPTHRRGAFAAALGQSFNFDMQNADWTQATIAEAIEGGLTDAAQGGSTTWLLGCHDSPRVASRFGLVVDPDSDSPTTARKWLLSDGTSQPLDRALGERRARAAALALMALPGSMYIYQGDELGLHEVADLPHDVLQDPIAFRNAGVEKGRDGCRVPIPWSGDGPGFGFGSAGTHLPQPSWFKDYSVEVEDADPNSTLNFYRTGLASRKRLLRDGYLRPFAWVQSPTGTLRFRHGGIDCLICFNQQVAIDPSRLVLSSTPIEGNLVGPDQTVWLT